MEKIRRPFQGVFNIVRFNWHFYIVGLLFSSLFIIVPEYFDVRYAASISLAGYAIISLMLLSLSISYYVYDFSDLYKLLWVDANNDELIINITAGYDETSPILKNKYPLNKIIIMDFFESLQKVEVSLQRARESTYDSDDIVHIQTNNIPIADSSVDMICIIFSAHEIRNNEQKVEFFKEVNRILKPSGRVYVAEHCRDFANFCAYTIGFFHFFSQKTWLNVFDRASLNIKNRLKITPFVSVFILQKNGNSL